MASTHAKVFRISGAAFKRLGPQMREMAFEPRKRDGFIIDETTPSRIAGRYVFTKLQKIKSIDPASLGEEIFEQQVLATCTFAANLTNGLIRCNERRADMKILEEVFNGLDDVRCEIVDFNSDVVEIFKTLRASHGKTDLRALRIKDYLGREGLLTTANFKLMEPATEADILRKYHDQVQAVTASFLTEEGRQTLTIGKNGSLRYSDQLPPDMLEMTLNLLTQHHEDVELETVEV